MEENNNVVKEIMEDDFDESVENEKGGKHLRSNVWQSFSKLPEEKKRSVTIDEIVHCTCSEYIV